MKQILVISGKGGTGKTVFTGALAALAQNKVMADCDVDAADLHLLLAPINKQAYEFRSGETAVIDKSLCTQCGKCIDLCRFEAISADYVVDPIACEGCGFCSFACPKEAILMQENLCGYWFVSDTRFGPMVHAKLGIAEENSGKLVSLVRKEAKELAEKNKADWVIIDGTPGIGCPVIASLAGIDCALVVTEPTLSGLHDAARVIELAQHFSVPVKMVINKYDLNLEMSGNIEKYCSEKQIEVIGKINFDKAIVKSMVAGKTIIEQADCSAKKEIINLWEKLKKELVD